MTPPATHYIAERLTTRNWLTSIAPRLRRALRAGARVRFYYIDATPLGERLARSMGSRLGVAVGRLGLDAAHIYDENGLLVWLRTYYRDLQEVLQHIADDPLFPQPPQLDSASRNRLMYLRKQCVPGATLFAGPGTWRSVYLMHACRWHAQRADGTAASIVLWLENQPWFAGLQRYGSTLGGVELVPSGRAYRPTPLIVSVLARSLKVVANGLQRRRQRGRPAAAATPAAAPTIALQYYGHFNLDSPQLHSDFFFWQQSALAGRNVIGLFAFPQDPLDARRIAALAAHGMRGVALRSSATTAPETLFSDTAVMRNAARALAIGAGLATEPRRAWTAAQDRVFESESDYWTRLLERCNAKVFLTWFKYTAEHAAIAEATKRTGGLFAVYQRSFEGNPSAQTAVVADLAFGFSKLGAEVERESGSLIDCYVVTGYLGDHRFPLVKANASAIRASLSAHGAEFIVAYFDEASFPDPRWGVGPQRTRSNYAFLLERVLREPRLGLVLKPKSPRTLRSRLGEVAELLTRALKTGRCHVLEEGVMQGSVPPVQAALAADVAIHESVAAGTAALEAALAGARTLIIDHDGWTISPLSRLGESVIFSDWEALWDALARIRSEGARGGFGDWSALLDELDPFRDGRAAERMGTFLKWIIESYEHGATRERALGDAAERYRTAWGADKVMRVQPAASRP